MIFSQIVYLFVFFFMQQSEIVVDLHAVFLTGLVVITYLSFSTEKDRALYFIAMVLQM